MSVIDDIDAAGNASCNVGYVGNGLSNNKQLLKHAADSVGVEWEFLVLLLAMGMLETQHLTSAERDSSKDNDGPAANVSLFNLSIDLVQQVGSFSGNVWDLCKTEHLADAVRVIKTGIDKWGVNSLLNFVRGGRTGWNDGHSYGVGNYRNTIKSMANAIRNEHSLLTDDRRVHCYLEHV